MFQIFNKKKFLVDSLDGFIDMHNHLLPGIDDGATTVEDSVAMIKMFGEIGVNTFIATPHIMHNYYPNDRESISASMSLLKNSLFKNGLDNISIVAAAEHMIDSNFEVILEKGGIMPLKNNYLLIEMSYLQPSINFDVAIHKIASERFFPILAHPERYQYLHKRFDIYKKYKEQGILFQMNMLSLGEFYGSEVQKTAHKLLEYGLIDFIGSDVHNQNQLNSLKELKVSSKTLAHVLPIIDKTIESFY